MRSRMISWRAAVSGALRVGGVILGAEEATAMGLSYRRAWGKVREIEANLGVKLVQSVVGGPGGGSTHLTPAAERLVAHYHRFRHALSDYAEREFTRDFEE